MPPTDRSLESATFHHVALSVGDLDAMVAFYASIGFDEVARADLGRAPVRLVTIANRHGVCRELVANEDSVPIGDVDPIAASRRRGLFHFGMAVDEVADVFAAAIAAGARVVTEPTTNARGDGQFAYIADPECNLIELVGRAPAISDERLRTS